MTTLRSYWQTSSKVFGRGSSSTHENLEKCEFAIRPITAHMLSKAPPRPREMFRTVLIHVKSRTQKNKRVEGLSGWILLWQDPPRRDPLASPTIPVSRPGPRPSRQPLLHDCLGGRIASRRRGLHIATLVHTATPAFSPAAACRPFGRAFGSRNTRGQQHARRAHASRRKTQNKSD